MKIDKEKKHYVGFILIGLGSTWYQGDNIGKVATKAAKLARQDWKHLFKLKNHVFTVNIYDITELGDDKEWQMDYQRGMRCTKTDKKIELLKMVYAV
tara:strand:+ start:163 stop:453 length:291 start_codon:yes stop_codon:yes gene_type:complete